MTGISRVLFTLLICLFATTLSAKPQIELPDPPPRESCNMATQAWEWDFAVTNGGFTTSSCDSEGYETWEWVGDGSGWQTNVIEPSYPNNAGDALISPTWTVGPDNYMMEVDHRYSTEFGFDGGNVKVNGQVVTPVGGYPSVISNDTEYYAWCVDGEAGYTGTVSAWVTDCFDLSPWWGQTISVSLEFGSDASVHEGSGWRIQGIAVGADDPETHNVTPDGTGDFATIQAAIDAAIPGDTILLSDGMFTGDGNRDLDYKGKAITIRSQSGDPELCYINCEGYVDDPHFGFVFHTGEGLDSVLEGVGIIQGFFTTPTAKNRGSELAAGITCWLASPTIRNCDISHGTALLPANAVVTISTLVGAGVSIYQASPVFEDCQITSNTLMIEDILNDGQSGWLNVQAAGIACFEAKPIIQNCTISNNIAEISATPTPLHGPELPEVVVGGGMAVYGGDDQQQVPTTDGCTLQGNSVTLNLTEAPDSQITQLAVGGGLALINHNNTGGFGSTSDPVFTENSVTIADLAGFEGDLTAGGAVSYISEGYYALNPAFFGNSADLPAGLNCPYTAAGAIAAQESNIFTILGQFSGNWASATPITLPKSPGMCSAAGAIAVTDASLESEDCTFVANEISATPITLPTPPPPLAAAGAVVLRESSGELSGCIFEENTFELGQNLASASMDTLFCAGAMVQLDTESMFTGCEFYANSCTVGEDGGPGLDLNFTAATGGFLQSSGTALLTDTQFYENTTQVFGDGTQLIAGGAVTDPITYTRGVNCLFGGNTAAVEGVIDDIVLGGAGGFGEQSSPDLESCHLWDNHANVAAPESPVLVTAAGGLAIRAAYPLLGQCGFYGNTGTLDATVMASLAGGVAFQNGSPELSGCVFENNSATGTVILFEECAVAGGLALRESAATLSGSTLVSNSGSRQMGTAAGGIDCRQNTTLTMSNTLIAFSEEGSGLEAWNGSNAELSCSDIFGNAGGDWVGYIEDQLDANGNIWEDPLFCGDHNPDARLTLASNSPCAVEANPDCGLIGAFDVGCGASSVDDQMPLPTVMKLHRGYPNPFNPQVTIKFDLPKTQRVRLSVFTLAGEMVTTLVQEEKTAGRHEVVWNGRDSRGREMPSGSYLVRLETASGTEGQKLMLVR